VLEKLSGVCKRLREGVDFSDSKNYFDDIAEVGPGGHFMMQRNTLAACRSDEFYVPSLCDRHTFESWVELGKPDLYSRAREWVEEIFSAPQKAPLPDDVIGKLDEIMRRADEELN
jgi:trimethylamine--corrinoid protein Co-methyltransferase